MENPMTTVMDGRAMATDIRRVVAERSAALAEAGVAAHLAIVLAGDDPGSRIYSASISKTAARLGVETSLAEPSADGVAAAIRALAEDAAVHGIIVQQPLPGGVPQTVVEEIPAAKDVDGATALSAGLLALGRPSFAPCTARAVVETLARSDIDVAGRHVVVVGRSAVVGKPLAALLLRKTRGGNATVTVCHTGTPDIAVHTRAADVVVAAMGSPEAIRGDMVAEGAVVIDVGVNRISDPGSERGYRVVGDVAFDEMIGRASFVTPVPGGVGSLTTALLLRNTVEAAEKASRAS